MADTEAEGDAMSLQELLSGRVAATAQKLKDRELPFIMPTQESMPVVEANASLVPEDQQQLVAIVRQNNLAPEVALNIETKFIPLFVQARDVVRKSREIVVTNASQEMEMKLARICRLELRAIRVSGEKLRKELKDEYVRGGRAIDGFNAILLHLSQTEEDRLQRQEDFAAIQEQERKAALKEAREKVLIGIQVDPNLYSLGDMTEETFQQLVEGTKLARAAEAERVRKAEAERIEREAKEQAERERIRVENERLKKEADEREAALKVERERVAKEKAEAEAKAKLERELAERELKRLADEKAAAELKARQDREAAEAKANADREAAEAETTRRLAEQQRLADEAAAKERACVAKAQQIAAEKARKEREEFEEKVRKEREATEEAARKERLRLQAVAEVERQKAETARKDAEARAEAQRIEKERIEADLKAERDAQAKRKADADEAARKAAAAPDKDRLLTYANAIRALEVPTFSTDAAQALGRVVVSQRDKLIVWIEEKAGGL